MTTAIGILFSLFAAVVGVGAIWLLWAFTKDDDGDDWPQGGAA